jgi:hypothetical protein
MNSGWNRWYIYIAFSLSVLVAFLLGMGSVAPTVLGEIHPDFRSDVRKMFTDFTAGKVLYHVKVELLEGITLDVAIVASYAGGDHGFVTTERPLGAQFYVEGKGFRIQRFNERNLFISITDWYVREHRQDALK